MKRMIRRIFWAVLISVFGSAMLTASDVIIKGVVTDNAGAPIRGVAVSASTGNKTISRFTQKDGRYEIPVAGGTYDVVADAYGYIVKRVSVNTAKTGDTNFKLSPGNVSVTRLTSAEAESLLPEDAQGKYLRARCVSCHSFATILHRRGQTAAQWKAFLPNMVRGTTDEPVRNTTPATLDALSAALVKFFGPYSPYFGQDADPAELTSKVEHVEVPDDALGATIVQYDVPTIESRPHSIEVDLKTNVAWFAEESYTANKATRFNMETEKFQEYPLLTPKVRPHTGAVGTDGMYWVALSTFNNPAKLASVDPETGEVKQYFWPEKTASAHTLTLDHVGNIWFSGGGSGDLWSFNMKKLEFASHKFNVPPEPPKGSLREWEKIPGDASASGPIDEEGGGGNGGTAYDVTTDNEGMVWFSELSRATLVRLNPVTGETKDFHPEGTVSIRGIIVDPQDNLWFGDFHGHRFGKMNVKTGEVKFYKPPTPDATPYGVAFNQVDGTIWYADMNGKNITQFNPKTERFTEYRIPREPDHGYPRFIAADSKGRVWFTEYFGDRIGFIDPKGESSGSQIASVR